MAYGQDNVTIDNFTRAETDRYLQKRADDGNFGRIKPRREPVTIDNQPVVRANRDTLYSYGVFDLTHPLTIMMPDAGERFMSLRAINQDHYIVSNTYASGAYEFTQESVGTRYLYVSIRTLANPDDPKDLAQAHALQDKVKWEQESAGKLELPNWDQEQLDGLRKAILGMSPYVPDSKSMFGAKADVDAVRHLIGTAGGWAGGPEWASFYINVTPMKNDGKIAHVINVNNVPVDGFWSITVYNEQGLMQKSESNAVSLNNITATKGADGYTIHLGGDRSAENYLEIFPGWNYTVRLYRARPEALNGSWLFPEAKPVED